MAKLPFIGGLESYVAEGSEKVSEDFVVTF